MNMGWIETLRSALIVGLWQWSQLYYCTYQKAVIVKEFSADVPVSQPVVGGE